MLDRFLAHRHWSIYAALGVWGSSGFMAQPTIASALYHAIIIPLGLGLVIFLARHEGKRT